MHINVVHVQMLTQPADVALPLLGQMVTMLWTVCFR